MEGAKRKAGIDAFFTPVAKKPTLGSEAAVNTPAAPTAGPAPPPAADDGLTVRMLLSRVHGAVSLTPLVTG